MNGRREQYLVDSRMAGHSHEKNTVLRDMMQTGHFDVEFGGLPSLFTPRVIDSRGTRANALRQSANPDPLSSLRQIRR